MGDPRSAVEPMGSGGARGARATGLRNTTALAESDKGLGFHCQQSRAPAAPKVDFLWSVDVSISMGPYQVAVSDTASQLFSDLAAAGIDTSAAVAPSKGRDRRAARRGGVLQARPPRARPCAADRGGGRGPGGRALRGRARVLATPRHERAAVALRAGGAGRPRRGPPRPRRGAHRVCRRGGGGFLAGRGRDYRRGMSSPGSSAAVCSRLSPHLAMGTVSAREVLRRIAAARRSLEATPTDARPVPLTAIDALAARIHWRDHFTQKLEREPAIEHRSPHARFEAARVPTAPGGPRARCWHVSSSTTSRGSTGPRSTCSRGTRASTCRGCTTRSSSRAIRIRRGTSSGGGCPR